MTFSRTTAAQLLSLILLALLGSAIPVLGDGGVLLGSTTLLNSGDTANKIDLVFLGDGFTETQQGDFNSRVDEAVREFLAAHPLLALRSAFNVHRVNVSSPESGTDKFATCGDESTSDPDQSRRTALDTGYCNGGTGSIYRCMGSSNHGLALDFAAAAPDDDIVIVLVNDRGHGGCAFGSLTYFTLTRDFAGIVIHELGHAVFGLADEYNYDGDDTYTGPEPASVNITAEANRGALKWRDLVLSGTSIPTQSQSDCSDPSLPSRASAEDIVGTFEGAAYRRCGIFRPQYNCRMRVSNWRFCSVCRRRIIRTLSPRLGADLAISFDNLLVRSDHDPWPRGKGEIYMHYDLRSNAQEVSGRWPASGESSFDSGQSRDINVFAGMIPGPAAGSTAAVEVRVRENDWPDGDDTLSSDATENLPGSGTFSVDRTDYRLRGTVRPTGLRVLLDVLAVKHDQDGWPAGSGDIFVRYTVSNGTQEVRGRWPSSGTRGMDDGETDEMAVLAAAVPRPSAGNPLTVRVRVVDDDSWFTGGDDLLGDDSFTFDTASAFGADDVVHVRDRDNYRITLSVAPNP